MKCEMNIVFLAETNQNEIVILLFTATGMVSQLRGAKVGIRGARTPAVHDFAVLRLACAGLLKRWNWFALQS